MNEIRETIKRVIRDIQLQHSLEPIELEDDFTVGHLGFTSLDVGQLIATLELELGVDPFSEDVSIVDVVTIRDFCRVYHQSLERRKRTQSR